MRYEEKRAEVQDWVEDAMDTLADEFDLEIKEYPFVLINGKRKSMDLHSLNITGHAEKLLLKHMSGKDNGYIPPLNVIYFGNLSMAGLTEESSHALHRICSGHKMITDDHSELLCLEVIKEMVGFFGSKVLFPEKENVFSKSGDYASMNQKQKDLYQKNISERVDNRFAEIVIHQQGYGLGERLYQAYIDGKFSKRRIRNLFKDSLRGDHDASNKFWQMRRELWPIKR